MASSSAAADALPHDKYDVFLSFCGTDTRQKFTSYLYYALKERKIDTYMDDRLKRGDEIEDALMEAIEQSKISIIVFSENYASSRWCLDELVHILECKQRYGRITVPVFYEIDPSNVRKQEGSYAHAFVRHEEVFKNNMDKVLIWRKAVSTAANLSGFHSKNFSPEHALVETIVKDILMKLTSYKLNRNSSTNMRDLFGIDIQIQQIELLLSIHTQDVPIRIVGIWGMGGIGKTTLADEVFHRLSSKFDSCSFLTNVREESEKYGIHHVRNKLLRELLKDESLNVGSPSIGSHLIERLSRTKALVVLDDVNDSSQLKALLGDQVGFSWGSRIIITSRDRRLLKENDVEDEHIYPVKGLEINDALKLFHLKASKDGFPKTDCYDLSRRAAEICNGVPLALKVLSPLFRHCNTREDWEDELNRWQNFPNKKIEDALRPSYNGLQEDEKGIFLDIACFFKGEKRSKAERMLEMHGFSARRGIDILINKSLISISGDNHLEMHDLLQEMGQSIVHEQCTHNLGKRSRLWNAKDVYQVLKNRMGTTKLQAIHSDISTIPEIQLSPDTFKNMHNLRLLKFSAQPNADNKMHLPEGLESFPEELRYLYWEKYPSRSLPSGFSPHNLVELHMPNGKVEKLWHNNDQKFGNLKKLNLRYCQHLIEVPDFSQCPNIEKLILTGCKGLFKLCVEKFDKLTTLKLASCWSLKVYPELPCNVQHLNLSCSKLTKVPDLSRCANIEKLYLYGCEKLVQLPNGYLKHLAKLTTLDMARCSSLIISPQIPCSLRILDLSSCSQLTEVPDLSQCPNIEAIDLCRCTSLVQLPKSIFKNLDKLTRLQLAKCSSLKVCPELPRNLRQLDLSSCSQLTEVPDLSRCPNVEEIDLCRCTSLVQLPKSIFINLDKLTRLQLAKCSSLKVCPELPRNIRYLNLSYCSQLTEVPDLSVCSGNIEEIDLGHCTSLVQVPDSYVRNLDKLTSLFLKNCSSLKVFPKIPQNVRNLHAPSCSQLTEFPDISGCPNIERIDLSHCISLVHVPPYVKNLDFFRYPDIEINLLDCTSLDQTPSIIRKRS
ncbi:disease resistance protein RUN1-like [Rosa sericea]